MTRQADLLGSLADHLLEQGLGEMSLRPMAASVGSTARMLIYHFNSKDELLRRVLAELRKRQGQILERWKEPAGHDFPESFWSWISSRRLESHARLWIDLHTIRLSSHGEIATEVRRALGEWNEAVEGSLLAAGWSRVRARTAATLLLSTYRGLLMDLHANGDRARLNAAAHEFAKWWRRAD